MLIALGALLATFVFADAVVTVINITQRSGPIASTVHRGVRALSRGLPHRIRAITGVVITLAIVLSWTFGLWIAWTVAMLDPAVAIRTADGQPVDGLAGAVYVAGFSIFTLGTGDLEAGTAVGRLVTVFASFTGLFTVTFEVTYLLSLLTAVAHERSTARKTFALGPDVATIVRRSWDGRTFRTVEPLLHDVARDLVRLAEDHRTFKVLHDVLPTDRSTALGPSLLALSDAADVLHYAADEQLSITELTHAVLTAAIDGVIAGMPEHETDDEPPPPSDPAGLFAVLGIPAARRVPVDDENSWRRRCLYALATEEGWRSVVDEAVGTSGTERDQ